MSTSSKKEARDRPTALYPVDIEATMAGNGRIAVVGLGSPIMCDDAVGLHVSEAVDALDIPDVDCFQEAIGGIDILPVIYGYSHAIVVDAIMTGQYGPGSVVIFDEAYFDDKILDTPTHEINLPTGIRIGRKMNPDLMPDTVDFVAIEIQDMKTVSEQMTPEVEAAVDSAKNAVLHVIEMRRGS